MKKLLLLGLIIGFVFVGSISSYGAVFTFTPNPADLYDLDHYKAYSWGINWNSSNYPITSAYLTFTNIRNWINPYDPTDILYMGLLDNAALGVTEFNDYYNTGDYFGASNIIIDTWTDADDNLTSDNLTINFSSERIVDLNNFASDGLFGLSFDPDCHYYNDGVQLTINADVPEPTTILLFGLGSLGMAFYRKRH